QGGIGVVLDHLQIIKTGHQTTTEEQHEGKSDKRPVDKDSVLADVVFEVSGCQWPIYSLSKDRKQSAPCLDFLKVESTMVGMVIQDSPCAIKLLRQQNTYQGVWQRQTGQRPLGLGSLSATFWQPVRATHQQAHILTGHPPVCKLSRKVFSGPGLAGDFQGNHPVVPTDCRQNLLAFLLHRPGRIGVLATLAQWNFHQLQGTV